MSMLVQQSGNVKPPQSILNGSTNDSCVEVQLLHEESQMYHSRWPTYPNCFGLPYQDHNYGAPPPPTPPASPPAIVKVNGHLDIDVSCNTVVVTTPTIVPTQLPTPTTAGTDDSVTRCICDFQHDDGYMICCDECGVWQHVDCMGVDRDNIPEIYHCERCQPRKLDKQRAVQLQRKRRALLLDSSATETEDETTKHNGVLQQKKVKKKKKKSRKENKDGMPGMGGNRPQWGGNRKHSPPSAHHPPIKFGRKVQPQHNGVVGGGIQNKPKKFDQNRHAIKKLNKAKMPKITSKALNMSCEDAHGPWDIGLLDSYEEAKGNQYSIDIKSLLANQPLNGQRMNSASGAGTKQLQLPDQLCRVAQVTPSHKGLEVLESVRSNQPLIEYKGKVMLREQYDKENIFFKRLHPFVLFYSKFEGLQLCVDASVYANDARYVRRSCTPNAQVQHMWENDRVHFYIYASKHIAKGSEVTIPFDFNYEECCYGVECACTKTNCPVLRLQKKVSDGHPVAKPARRRKRSSSGTDNGVSGGPTTPQPPPAPHAPLPHRNSSNDDIDRLLTLSTVAAAAATVATTPMTKRRKLAPLRISGTVNKLKEEEVEPKKEVTSPVDTKPPEQPPAAPPPTPASAPINSPPLPAVAPVSEPVSSESAVKTEPAADATGDDEDPADSAETDNAGGTQSEKDHKMTREERKMEAILKAFERLEKREERRKEALARLEHSRKSKEAHPVDTPAPDTKDTQSKDTDSDNKPEKTKPKGKKRRPSGTPARRRSRPSSSVSTATESATSADEGSSLPPNTPMEHSPGSSTPSSAAVFDHAFKFPKTKKHLMSEWLNENENAAARLAGHAKTEPLEINTSTGGDATVEFVKCIPSPQAHSFSRLRRSSISAGASKGATSASTGSTSGGAGVQLDSSIGSAKKRWLRQAMSENSDCDATPTPTSGCDTTGAGCDVANSGYMSPLSCTRGGTGGASPNPCAGGAASPGASPPVDFVTPLKKRRLARESLESPFPFPSAAAAVPTAAVGDSQGQGQGESSSNTSEAQKGSCEAAPLPTEHHTGEATSSPFRDSCQPSRMSPDVSSGDNLFEKFGVPSQQRAAVVAPPDSPTVSRAPERVMTPRSEPEPSDQSDSPISAVQYTNADSTELTSVTVTRPCSTPSQSAPDSVGGGAVVASTGTTAVACQGSSSSSSSSQSNSNNVETSTDVVDPCTSCSEVDTKCTSTEPTVSSRNSCDEAVSTAAVPSSCHSECDSTAVAATRDSVTVATSCSSTSRDVGEGRTACGTDAQAASSQDGHCCVAVSGSRTCATADVVVIVTTTTAGCSVTDSQAVVSVACSQNDSVGTSSTNVSCGGAPVVAAESSSGIDCALRTAVASCSSCHNSSPVLDSCVDAAATASVELGSSSVVEAPSSTPQQCSVIDSGGDSDLHSSVFTADSSLEESQRHGQTDRDRTDDSPVVCSVSEQPTISCSGTQDSDDVGGSSEAGQACDNASDGAEIEKEEGEITDDDDGCGSVTGTAEEESRAIVNSICRRARELREAEISSSRHYYVKRSRSQSSFSDGHADSSSVSGTSSTPALAHGDAHHRDSQSPTHPSYRWDSPVDSTSPNQHFDLSRTDATSSTQGDTYRDSYVDNSRSPASSSGDASNSSFFSSCGASETSGPSSTCTFFGMDQPSKKKVSLSEYRKRIKQQKVSVPPRGASSNGSSSHRTTSPLIGRDSGVQPRLAPLPMFNTFRSPELGNGLQSPPLPPPPPPSEPHPDSEEAGAQWGASPMAAAVEKTREQTTSLSLTERLRREFGLDTTSESDEDTNDKAGRRQKEGAASGRDSPSMPPPPPPPPPPPAANSGYAAPPVYEYPPVACVSDRSLTAGHQTSPVPPPPPPPPPPQIHSAPYYHHPVPVTMALPPAVTTTLPPQHIQSIYPTAMNVSYGYTAVPVAAPLNAQVAAPLNAQVAPSPNGHVAPPATQQHMAYHSDSRQHASPVVTGPVQQMAAPAQAALMPQATGQQMAPVVPIQHIVQQVAPPSHASPAQQAAPIPHPGVAGAPQPAMSYPLDPRIQYVRPEQAPVAPPMTQTPAAAYPMQQQQQPPQQPLLPTPPAAVAPPQRPPPGPGPHPGAPRSIPSLMSLPSFPTKTFSSSLLTGVDHGSSSSSSSSSSSGSGGLTPQSNSHPGYTHPPHSSSSGAHPSPGPPSQGGFSQ